MRVYSLGHPFLGENPETAVKYVVPVRVFDMNDKPYPELEVSAKAYQIGGGEFARKKTDKNGVAVFQTSSMMKLRVAPIAPQGFTPAPPYEDIKPIPEDDYDPKYPEEIQYTFHILKEGAPSWTPYIIVGVIAVLGYLYFKGQ